MRKFGTISISLEMSLKNVKGFKKFEGENLWDKTKVHPPLGKPEGKNSAKIIAIKINKPRMVKLGSLVKENFGPSLNIIIITIRNIKITKNSGRRRMISPIFFKNYFVKINSMEKYSLKIGKSCHKLV
jgi:hypothetical protein